MKRVIVLAVLFALFSTTISAGVLSAVGNWALDNAITTIIACVFMLISAFWGATKWGAFLIKSKVPIQEAIDIARKIHEVRRPTSPGGKTITEAEKDEVLKEVEEFIRSIVNVFGKGK